MILQERNVRTQAGRKLSISPIDGHFHMVIIRH